MKCSLVCTSPQHFNSLSQGPFAEHLSHSPLNHPNATPQRALPSVSHSLMEPHNPLFDSYLYSPFPTGLQGLWTRIPSPALPDLTLRLLEMTSS